MQCENAYKKDGVKYLLCKKAKEPDSKNMSEVAHAMCAFQRFCPNAGACTQLPTWTGCKRRDVNKPETKQESAELPPAKMPTARTAKKKNAQAASESAESEKE